LASSGIPSHSHIHTSPNEGEGEEESDLRSSNIRE